MTPAAKRRRRIWQVALLTAGLMVLVAISATAILLVNRARTDSLWVTHTLEVENQVSLVQLQIRRAESAVRGFLLTGDNQYATDFDDADRLITPSIDRLRDLTTDNPFEQKNVEALRALSDTRFMLFRKAVAHARDGKVEDAKALLSVGSAGDEMDRIRDISLSMRGEENRLFELRSYYADRSQTVAAIVTVAGSALIVLFAILSIFLIRASARARDHFAAVAADRELLLREVNHRVGNSLQIISSLLHLQASSSTDDDVKAALSNAMGRVAAVAQVHRRLYTSHNLKTVLLNQYLEALLEDLRRSTEGNKMSRLTLHADPIEIDPDRAVAIGIIVNELVLNAVKYAYPNGPGPIHVDLHRKEPNIELAISDEGVGFQAKQDPRSTGMGQRIVSAMAVKLDATVERDPAHSGTRIVVMFTASNQNGRPVESML